MSFTLSHSVDPDRIFITRSSALAKRWDPYYHVPSLVALEGRVAAKTSLTLRHFIESMAGGSTPLTKDAEEHYTEGPDGIPFIRVQNLTTKGVLNLEDCKKITRSTHEGLLRRSRLSGGELLVKITGVGRMAVASVVPDGFEGNINQHMVAIKTKDRQTSELLAAWLNLDVAEKLASRRATGGTRPALDYPALRSIPVIPDSRMPALINKAVSESESKLNEAKQLLTNIDTVLLERLGIKLPEEPPNLIENRIFRRQFSEVTGQRFDPGSHWKKLDLTSGKFTAKSLRAFVYINPLCSFKHLKSDDLVSFVPMDAVSDEYGEIRYTSERLASESKGYTVFQEGDLIWAKITPCMENGKSAMASNLTNGLGYGSTEFHVFRPRNTDIEARYLYFLLRLKIVRDHAKLFFSGASGHQRVDQRFFDRLEIPLPKITEQVAIADELDGLRDKAKMLSRQAVEQLGKAKSDIETIILGKGSTK